MTELKLDVRMTPPEKKTEGTLGWLMERAAYIDIYTDDKGDPVAWLKDHDGGIILLLAGRNLQVDESEGDPAGTISVTNPDEDDVDVDGAVSQLFSDEAWEVIRKIQKHAVSALYQYETACDGVKPGEVDVILVKVRDRDAAAMARSPDPAVLPILKDRLGEVM